MFDDKPNPEQHFVSQGFDAVVNLAAQAVVRYSITNPSAYIDSNIILPDSNDLLL